MFSTVKMSWDVEPSISFTGTSCCFFPEPPNRLIPEEEDVEESELRLACLSQMDNCVLTALKWSSTSLSRAWLWEQRVWRKERAARTRSSS